MNRKIIIISSIIILLILVMYYKKQENLSSETLNNLSNEAVQNIASVYSEQTKTITMNNLNVTGNINGNVTGNVTGNLVGNVNGDVSGNLFGNASLNNLSSNVSGSPIIVNSSLVYNSSLKPRTLALSLANYKGPIYDASGNTFPTNAYTIKQINGSCITGVRNDKWWICPYPAWNEWTGCTLEIIPIPLNQYYSYYETHPSITTDVAFNAGRWAAGPYNAGGDNYVVYDQNGVGTVNSSTPTTTS